MAQEPPHYVKLPGKATGFVQRSTMWFGRDHLLKVITSGYTEEYKRFYLKDIQAITVQLTMRWHVYTVLLICLLVLWIMIGAGKGSLVSLWFLIGAGLLVTLLIINLARGASCTCRIHTAVQANVIPSIRRARVAARFIEAVRPLILEAQSEVAPVSEVARAQAPEAASTPEPEAVSGPEAAPAPEAEAESAGAAARAGAPE